MLRRLLQLLWPTADMSPGARRAVNTLRATVAILLIAVGLLVTRSLTESKRIDQQVTRATAITCDFYRDLGEATLPPRATEFGVKIVVDSRRIFLGLRCTGRLAPPSPPLRRLAGKYRIALDG